MLRRVTVFVCKIDEGCLLPVIDCHGFHYGLCNTYCCNVLYICEMFDRKTLFVYSVHKNYHSISHKQSCKYLWHNNFLRTQSNSLHVNQYSILHGVLEFVIIARRFHCNGVIKPLHVNWHLYIFESFWYYNYHFTAWVLNC